MHFYAHKVKVEPGKIYYMKFSSTNPRDHYPQRVINTRMTRGQLRPNTSRSRKGKEKFEEVFRLDDIYKCTFQGCQDLIIATPLASSHNIEWYEDTVDRIKRNVIEVREVPDEELPLYISWPHVSPTLSDILKGEDKWTEEDIAQAKKDAQEFRKRFFEGDWNTHHLSTQGKRWP